MKNQLRKKYQMIKKIETRSIKQSLKSTQIELKNYRKNLKNLTKKISAMNKQIGKITRTIVREEQQISSSSALITSGEMKLSAARQSKSNNLQQYMKELESLKKNWNQHQILKKKLDMNKVVAISTLKKYMAQADQIRRKIKEASNAYKTYLKQEKETKKRIDIERTEDVFHRSLYLVALGENSALNKEARKIESKLMKLRGDERKKAHLRLKRIHHIVSKNMKIMKVQKKYINVIDEKQNNLKGIMKKIGNENSKHVLKIKKNARKLTDLKEQRKQWRKQKDSKKKVLSISRDIDEVQNEIDIESDRHTSALNDLIKNSFYVRINAIKKEIKLLRKEKRFLKAFVKGMKGKKCIVDKKAIAPIREAMEAEQKKFEERIKKTYQRIQNIKDRIKGLKREKVQLRDGLKKITMNRIKDANSTLRLQMIKVKNLKKIVRKLLKVNKEGNVQGEYERIAEKLNRSINRMKALREIRDAAERDSRTIRLEEFRELNQKQTILKHIIRQLTFRRKQMVREEHEGIAKMALQKNDCYRRRHIWKKVRFAQNEQKEIAVKIDRVSRKFIKVTQRIRKEEEKMMNGLKDADSKLIEKKNILISKIKAIQEGLKKQNNEKKYRIELEKIEDLKGDIRTIEDRIASVRAEIRRTTASLLLRKHEEQYKVKNTIYKQGKRQLTKLRKDIAQLSKKIIIQESMYEQTIFEKRKPIELNLQAMKEIREKKEKKVNQLVKTVEKAERQKISEAYRVIAFLRATIANTEKAKKEYMKMVGQETTEFKSQYEYLAQMANNDIIRMKKQIRRYERKVHTFRKKLVEFKSEKTPCKICVELGRRAKEALAMNMDNTEILRNVQDRCRFFPENERGKCYSMAFKISKYATNLFDPQEFNVKKMCVILKGCDTI